MKRIGRVALVGAGPGSAELLTLKAARLISTACTVVYDRLVSAEIMAMVPECARLYPVGKAPKHHPVPQQDINRLLVGLALSGKDVVRLKGGDPFIFGRGSEEAAELRDMGVPVEVVPGITAAQGAAAATGVPLTHRGLATGVRYVTGHCRADTPLDLDWAGLADPQTTLVVYMGAANIAEIASRLVAAGLARGLPVMAVNNATTARECRIVSDLGDIAGRIEAAALSGPVLFIIGHVVSLYNDCPADLVSRLAVDAALRPAYA